MPRYTFILGSHPALSVVEVLSYFTRMKQTITPDASLLPRALTVETTTEISAPDVLRMLGGTPAIVRLAGTASSANASEILRVIPEDIREEATELGLSIIDTNRVATAREARVLGMALKKAAHAKRVVLPQESGELTSAQLFHAYVPDRTLGVVVFRADNNILVGTVAAVQDIAAYARRDRERPGADPGSGMLPPKVAQMLINISLVPPEGTIYDPFCGTGTIPMEATLMGLRVFASDRAPTQVDRTKKNLAWLRNAVPTTDNLPPTTPPFVHDLSRGTPPLPKNSLDAIVTEGWLGPARRRHPLPREAEEIFQRVSALISKALQNTVALLQPGGRVVITMPVFRLGKALSASKGKRVLRFPTKDLKLHGLHFDSLLPEGLDHEIFREAHAGTLLYGRPDAIVLREIVRLRVP